MITFFSVIVAAGLFLIYTDHYANKHSDSIPVELVGGSGVGILMVGVAAIGIICVAAFR